MPLLHSQIKSVTAFAPATGGNMIVGFDILGFAFDAVGDSVTLTRRDDKKIVIEEIDTSDALPFIVGKNTASRALEKICEDMKLECGFSIKIKKGIPLSSGMGGSAASAVAALTAFNQFLCQPLSEHQIAYYALFGEEVASGQKHSDNVVPCVFGGITLIRNMDYPMDIIKLPCPDLQCVIIHPHLKIETKSARNILKSDISLKDYVHQSGNLAATIAALFTNDIDLLQRSLSDIIIEPQRSQLLPGFAAVKAAAMETGALGASLSGSGPTMVAFTKTNAIAKQVAAAMINKFKELNVLSDYWITPIAQVGAKVTDVQKYN